MITNGAACCVVPMSWVEPSVIIQTPVLGMPVTSSSCNVTFAYDMYRLCLSVNGEGVMYSTRGEVKKRWRWGGDVEEEEGELMAFQPLSLSLNKSLLLQCSGRDQLLVTFSVAQQRVKFIIPRKLKEVNCRVMQCNIEITGDVLFTVFYSRRSTGAEPH